MRGMKKLQILDIGCGPKSIAVQVFEPIITEQGYEYELVTVDIDPENKPDYVHDIRKPFPPELLNRFDLILASHVLEHVERYAAIQTVKNIYEALAPGGELWAVVPSLEWCVDEIRKGTPNSAVWLIIYGGGEPDKPSYYYHNQGFTLPVLRDLLTLGGFVIRRAYQTPLPLHMKSGKDGTEIVYHARQDVVIAAKPGDAGVEIIG